jgi:putative transposase
VAAGDIVPAPGARLEETLASASPDVLREMIRELAQRMMDAEVEAGRQSANCVGSRESGRSDYAASAWHRRNSSEWHLGR